MSLVPQPMQPSDVPQRLPRRELWTRFRRSLGEFLVSAEGRRSAAMLLALVLLLVAVNALNVVNSYVGRDFISAIEARDRPAFIGEAWRYLAVFAASTVVAVFYRFLEEHLGLLWRSWQTREILRRYLDRQAFYRLEAQASVDNPDQRIAEDVRTFTTTTLSFALMMLNASFTVLAFSGVLWSISPRLFGVAVLYALIGSAFTAWLGRPLIELNNRQLDREADFRADLMQLREHAGAVALLRREEHLRRQLLQRFAALAANTRRMIAVNRNLGFFANGYNYLMQIVPALIVAPLFIDGDVAFGVVTQSAMAFTALMGAFSLVVTQFQSISSYAAVVGRLGRLIDAMEYSCMPSAAPLDVQDRNGQLVFRNLTLFTDDGQVAVRELDVTIDAGLRVLISGARGATKLALFKATAGLHCAGSGHITRPDPAHILFVPELPYLPRGSLRDLLLCAPTEDEAIWHVLRRLDLLEVAERHGGLDAERDWGNVLGISEQAALVVARVLLARPQWVFFDRMSVAMDRVRIERVLDLLGEDDIGYLVIGKPEELASDAHRYDATLHFAADGSWQWRRLTSQAPA